MISVEAILRSHSRWHPGGDRRPGRAIVAWALVGGTALGGCFNPDDSPADSATDGTDSTTTMAPTSTSPTLPTMTGTTNSTGTTVSTSAPTSTTDSTSTTDADSSGTDESSTGDVSDCPGGDPTPGEAPYVLTTVIAQDDADDVDIGDIDGDEHLDLISLSRIDGSVETFWGDGTGGFASDGVTVLDPGGFPDTVRLGAIADDTVDLFVHMEGPVELWVVRGDGAGNWPSPQVYTNTYLRALDIADFNGDDVLDLAYVGAANLEVRLGINTETYADPDLYGANTGSVLRVADITGEGNLDILTAEFNSTELEIYAGAGDGTFQAQPTVVTGSPVTGIDAGDLDGDDLLDLALTTVDDLRVFYGEAGGGVSTTPGTIIADALGRVRVADVDADGIQDLITRSGTTTEIRFAEGGRTFADAVSFECPSGIQGIEVGDLNEDCVPDIVGAMGPDQDLCVLLSDRD